MWMLLAPRALLLLPPRALNTPEVADGADPRVALALSPLEGFNTTTAHAVAGVSRKFFAGRLYQRQCVVAYRKSINIGENLKSFGLLKYCI
jgi:hypothetical protein